MNPRDVLLIAAAALVVRLSEAKGEYYYDEQAMKFWHAEPDSCEICEENEAEGWIDQDGTFPSGDDEPPAHPNAVLSGSLFLPYGGLLRMVAAEYDGLAVTLNAGDYHTTIGPNHPMLTTRGLIPAKLLSIGDDLLCDRRGVHSPILGKPNLDQIGEVQDCFGALLAAFGDSAIPATRYDFHGDAVLREEEIKVVFPKWKLLFEADPGGLECLGEIPFMETDVKLQSEARLGAFAEQFRRFLLTSAGGVGGSGVSHFEVRRIDNISTGRFRGWAFDASTSVGLYCSDGFVVSNCKCEIEYKDKRVRVYV